MISRLFRAGNISAVRGARIAALFAVGGLAVCAALAAGRPQIAIDDTRGFPESMTSTANGTVFFGSISKGMVYRAAPGSASAEPWIKPGTGGLNTVLGVFADEKARTLWVCSSVIPGVSKPDAKEGTALKAFDIKTGAFKASYAFPGGKGICNDIAVAPDGTIYATETGEGQILRLKKGASALEVWASGPLLASADGIALLADGSVYINGFTSNLFVRVPVKADGSAGPAEKLDTSRPLKSPDGLRSVGPKTMLMAEGEGRLDEVTVQGNKATIRVLKDGLQGPTAVALVGGTAFVLEAKLNYFMDPKMKGQDPGPLRALAVPYRAPK